MVSVAHAINLSIWEAEASVFLWVQGQPDLQSKFENNQNCYTEKLCLRKKNDFKKCL